MHHLLRERMRLLPLTALLCALFLLMVACAPAHRKTTPDAGLELRLLHVNDTHAFLAGIDEHMNACFEAADCRGGLARISAAIQTARQEQDNVIALDAGDQFQGTLFYSVNKWPVIAAADALLPYDAMTLGNHEFDEGCRELARFLEAQPLPVLAANLTPQQGCPLAGSRIRPYLVRTVRGTRVGIIGLGIQNIMDPGTAGHLPDARPLASSAMREAGLDELYNSRKAAQQLEAALCPPVGDGSLLQPELFHMELQGALTALRDSDKPAVRAFVRDELAPLLENTELLRAYTGLMVGG